MVVATRYGKLVHYAVYQGEVPSQDMIKEFKRKKMTVGFEEPTHCVYEGRLCKVVVSNLRPATSYAFRVVTTSSFWFRSVQYTNTIKSTTTLARTTAPVPDQPLPPTVQRLTACGVQLGFAYPPDNGYPVKGFILYEVKGGSEVDDAAGMRLKQAERSRDEATCTQVFSGRAPTVLVGEGTFVQQGDTDEWASGEGVYAESLSPGAVYTFAVEAINEHGRSPRSAVVLVRIPVPPGSTTGRHQGNQGEEEGAGLVADLPPGWTELYCPESNLTCVCAPCAPVRPPPSRIACVYVVAAVEQTGVTVLPIR